MATVQIPLGIKAKMTYGNYRKACTIFCSHEYVDPLDEIMVLLTEKEEKQ